MTLTSFVRTPPPHVAVSIAPRRVAVLALAPGSRPAVSACLAEELAEGAVTPALSAPNIVAPDQVAAALGRLLARLPRASRRVALVVPDSVAKVSLVRLEKVPSRQADLAALVQFHVRKAAPFRIEEGRVAWTEGATFEDGTREFLVTLARRDVIAEYERVATLAGVHAGVVDLTTFNLANLVLEGERAPEADWLLVHVGRRSSSLAILRGRSVIFFRNRQGDEEADLADMVHQTAMYYEDRLEGRGFERVVLAGWGGDGGTNEAPDLRRQLEARLRVATELVDPRTVAPFADRIGATPELLELAAPLVGILVRGRAGEPGGHARIMLRTNLATRPFYNERAVLLVVGTLVVALGLAGVALGTQYVRLSREQARLGREVTRAEARVAELQREARRFRESLDREEVGRVAGAAAAANLLIDRRVFSWTALLGVFETTLPDAVRIVSIAPGKDLDGQAIIQLKAVGKRAEEIDTFVANLSRSGAFTDVISTQERLGDGGSYEVVIEGRYLGAVPAATGRSGRNEP